MLGHVLALALGVAASTFHSGGRDHPIEVSKDHVVVRGTGKARAAAVTEKEARAFAQMGVQVVARGDVAAGEQIVGYPVWFDRKHSAVGVLTHEIVVRLARPEAEKHVRATEGFAAARAARFDARVVLAEFKSPMAALEAANGLRGKDGVVYAHPNFMIPKDFRTDPLFSKQWHLENTAQNAGGVAGADVHARGAWELTSGDPSVVVAALDGGFEMTHPDLAAAWYVNAGEIPGNGVDDDGNGYVDDVAGWNFEARSNDPGAGAYDDHGTAVAGLVGARRNGRGVTGLCPECSVLPVVVSFQPADDAAAFRYAGLRGAHVITNSWGYPVGTPITDVVEEAIDDVATHGRGGKGAIVLFAMNNIDQDDCIGAQPDISSLDSVIAVSGASDQDEKVVTTAWGDCMEVLAPTYAPRRPGIVTTDLTGVRGYNTGRSSTDLPDVDYTNDFGGTSAATPTTAATFGLMLAVNPELTRDEALALLVATADKIRPDLARYDPATGFSRKYGYGRVNAKEAVRAAQAFRKYSRGEKRKEKDEARGVKL